MRLLGICVAAALLCCAPAPTARAGDLTPPGAPAPSMKTLTQVEPRIPIGPLTTPGAGSSVYRITQSGAYYLTGDVIGEANKSGILIQASDVSVDLMGFSVIGAPSSIAGVTISGSGLARITVRNGVVRNWGLWGIELSQAAQATVVECAAIGNGAQGIVVGDGSSVIACIASDNAGSGVQTGQHSIVRDVRAGENGQTGVQVGSYSTIVGAVSENNGGRGINAGTGVLVAQCTASFNDDIGVGVGPGSTISECAAVFNQGSGFSINTGTNITGCAAYANVGNGIEGFSDNRIEGNACDNAGNGGDAAGIRVTASDNTIVGNSVTDSDRGIEAISPGNFIARNTASGNTVNYEIVAGNVCFVVTATTSGAISGSSGGVSPGSTDPNANYSY